MPIDQAVEVPPEEKPAKTRYHHGDLKDALLKAAERVLTRDGVDGLTLREVAREAGVSHAAPKNHFDNLGGLLSELAAIGFERFHDKMVLSVPVGADATERMIGIGSGYVTFARCNREMFLLMFRSEKLDYERPALRKAADAAFGVLSSGVGAQRREALTDDGMTLDQAASAARSWAMVHGFAMLLVDGRLQALLSRAPDGTTPEALLDAAFGRAVEASDTE